MMAEPTHTPSAVQRVLREPTLHFAVLAGALFAASAAFRTADAHRIEIDRADVSARIQEIEQANGIVLTAEERRAAEEAWVDEQILLREALAMGLEDDPRIADFLVQKMLHVLSADVIQPTDAELTAYYEANLERYAPRATVTVDELIVPVSPLPAPLLAQLEAGTPPERLDGGVALRHSVLPGVSLATLTSIVGPETAGRIFGAPPHAWVGPHQTVRGEHWFRVTERSESEPLPLASVREQVRLDWIGEQEEERLERRVLELRDRYSIVFTEAGEPR